MDSKQIWYGNYWKLDDIYNLLRHISAHPLAHKNIHELFITWVVAKFLEYQKKSEHAIGFPTIKKVKNTTLLNLIESGQILQDDNFDTVIAEIRNRDKPIRLQIKRYSNPNSIETEDFLRFLLSKVRRYGKAPELNLVFHICSRMKLELQKFDRLVKGTEIRVASVWVFGETPGKRKCFLLPVHPEFTGQLWSPSPSL